MILCAIIIQSPQVAAWKLHIFIHVKTETKIKEYATIAHLYYVEGTFSKEDVHTWMDEYGLEVVKLLKGRIEFTYTDDWYKTKMTIWKNGKVEVEANI